MNSQTNEQPIRDFSPDRQIVPHLVDNIMAALDQSSEAAYMVFLKLATRFGSGQKI